MDDRVWRWFAQSTERLVLAMALGPVRARLLGVAAFGRPARVGTRWEGELLVVVDPLPPRWARAPWLEAGSGLRLRLLWKGPGALAYPSPRYLEILRRGAILHDPEGLLASTFDLFLDSLTAHGLKVSGTEPFPCWSVDRGWPDGPLTPARPQPVAAGRGGSAPGP
ncbi:hypothetical protein [Limnochorda pilosa]|uniref:Uncharacterized protein n=1 Tax=Limnochorda pilosa TaxID=1555112 RepID=A0A0K2SIZ3_LIMPI|nr:hypothetical protein [Limnochorda pilosa]BAS27060.1 hypothetical protein LIP_1203 [Limnochorda pilosa]